MIIDAHQHFWKYQKETHAWIDDSMRVIQKDFFPVDLHPVLLDNGIDACIAVQADQTPEETQFLVDLASKNNWIKAVIGWVDLNAADIETQLVHWKQYPIIKGFRHILQTEEPAFMLRDSFKRGIRALQELDYCYEILIYPQHLDATWSLVQQFQDMRFIIDHIAKPNIKSQEFANWQSGIERLATYKNVYCKISGMVTEANWTGWIQSDFEPYLNIVTEAFGVDRLIYGSDWPVCLIAADYKQQLTIYKQYFRKYKCSDTEKIFGENATQFYHI